MVTLIRKKLTAAQAAYIAGLIDGEGTITLTRKHRNENRQLAVTISNTERKLLDYVKNTVEAGKITRKRITQRQHTASFTYAVYNRQAHALLEQIAPFLRSYKALRCRIILQDYLRLTPRNGKYSRELLDQRREFEERLLQTKPG